MTAETDIAAINDAGNNTAAEVRTALTSVLRRGDGMYEGVTYTDQGMSDEFSSGTLDAQWTAVGMVSGTVDLTVEAATLTDSVYDLTTESGVLLVQVKSNDDCGLRIDDMITDGEELVVAFGLSGGYAGANVMWFGVGFNDTDSGAFTGSGVGLFWDGPNDTRWLTLATNTLAVPEVAGYGVAGGTHFLRFYRSGNGLWAWVSSDGKNWANAWEDRQSPAANLVDNTWLYFNIGGMPANTTAPIIRIPWVRHMTYSGYRPNWTE